MRYYLPYLAYITAFGVIPFIFTFALVGINLKEAETMFKLVPLDTIFYNTLVFSLTSAIVTTVVGTLLAIFVDMVKKGKRLLSILVMLPYSIPFTSSALIWSISLYGNYGWFSYLFHIPFDPLYLASTAIWAVTGVNIWSMIPMSFLIMLSAFRSIPQEVREASEVDGLTSSQFYFRIALPMTSKAFLLSFLLQFILALGNFDTPYVLTQGGPGFASTTLPLLVYDEIFLFVNFSGGELAAALLGAISVIPALLILLLIKSKRTPFPSPNFKIPNNIFKSIVYAMSIFIIFLLDFPVYWMFLVALRPNIYDFRSPPVLLPTSIDLKYLSTCFSSSVPYLISSVVVALFASLLTIFLALPSSYEIERKRVLWLLLISIFLYSLPSTSYIIPLYLFFSKVGLLNTWWALILSTPVFTATFAVWIMFNFFTSFPRAYDEAAEVFGIKRKITKIITPLSRTTILSTFLLSFIFNWHLLFYPLLLSDTPYNMGFPPEGAETITIFALQAIGDETVNWAALASSALIAALPVMVISFFTIDRVIKSDSKSGLKFV
jgi:carbohydrate ABC transporter membrane protein 1, CUT1 family (TC 3.A.1.1.-)/carbohydrate ABC transporter membrane protein 2, CUT1 family (TC 3.A.1.1.-)